MPTPTGKQRRHAVSVFPTSILGASLALGLALSVALTGCGEDSTTTPAPAPAPAPSPAPAPDPVGTPGDLKVTAAGADFLEFGWEAVEGATGYEIQLSLKADDFTSVSTAMVTTTMHRFTDLAAETTGYARVRAHQDDRQSEWSETATGMSMAAPLVLGMPVPTVSSRGPDYIEWMWEAVVGALTYQVQVADSMDGFMDTMDPAVIATQLQAATTRREEVDPETTMYIRVRAAAGTPTAPLFGEWSAPVMGMSEVAPMPFTVSMWPPERGADSDCSGQAFCPDDGTDPAKAMASPNPRMLVTSSHPARITPMFGDGLPAVTVQAEENATPFRLVAGWNALQRAVVTEGAVFRFDRISVGAGQEATAMGDAMYITCGPFRCSEAAAERPDAPVVSADAVCEEFETNFRLVPGIRKNDKASDRYNGVDVGWLYTLSHPATVTHEFGNVLTRTGPLTVPGGAVRVTDTERSLSMVPASETSSSLVNKFGERPNRDNDRQTGTDPGPIRNGYDADGQPEDCEELTGLGNYDSSYQRVARSLDKTRGDVGAVERPPGCFRLMTDARYFTGNAPINEKYSVTWHDYVPDYRLHVDPQSAISWAGSSVAWGDDDPFADLKCERVTFDAADQLDVCADFQAEAEAFWGKGIDGGQFQPEFRFTGTQLTDWKVTHIDIRNKADAPASEGGGKEYRPDGSRHAHMWWVTKEDGTVSVDMAFDGTKKDRDLYQIAGSANALSGGDWWPIMSRMAVDGDGDPIGDFGKIDMVDASGNTPRPGSDGNPENWDDNPDADSCTDDDGGKGCDAVWSFDLSATLTRIADTETCTYPIELSLTCTWDADGDERRGGDTVFDTRTTNINRFITCEPS